VDFHDHLGCALRHLQFAPAFWEGAAVGRAGLYCNRLGLSEMLEAFAAAGFDASAPRRLVWHVPPLPPGGVHPALRRNPADDRVCFAEIEARPA
jgi:hypothetical protein